MSRGPAGEPPGSGVVVASHPVGTVQARGVVSQYTASARRARSGSGNEGETPSPASERLEKPGIGNVLGWVLGRRTEFIPVAPRRSHFWLDRDRMRERAKRGNSVERNLTVDPFHACCPSRWRGSTRSSPTCCRLRRSFRLQRSCQAFPVACLSRRSDHAIFLAFHGNPHYDSAPTRFMEDLQFRNFPSRSWLTSTKSAVCAPLQTIPRSARRRPNPLSSGTGESRIDLRRKEPVEIPCRN